MSDWNPRANELFLHAAELPDPAQREAYLKEHCGGDDALRQQVEALLDASKQAGSFMEAKVPLEEAPTRCFPVSDTTGTVVGPYKLLQKIGEGGMGSVWIAEQEKPVKRRVALKLIRTGMDSLAFLRRFEAERQALALMDHSNIAKVLDAGSTSDGRPYFVMEFIKGVPITKYCDELHLTLRERLELFVPVCQAIQHAHQKGIIHRDIKPSNILIAIQDGKPLPKIIDFGVAKALHQPLAEGTLMTEFGAVVGTLEYMSPEQAELSALDVDTRADVYALGVLLYELLTGSTPLNKKQLQNAAFVELLRVIKEDDPPSPSIRLTQSKDHIASLAALRRTEPGKLQKDVTGELDWIVMRCLEKDRTRRYESASALAQDVQRHLVNEPVLACPPSAGYRLKKWAARNTALIAFVVIIWCITLCAFGFSLLQWINARGSEQRALVERDQANEARRLSNEAVIEKTAALKRSEARRLASTALMKADSEPDLTGPLVQEALALENDSIVASTALAALGNIPPMTLLQAPSAEQRAFLTPCMWFEYLPDGKHLLVPSYQGERVSLYECATGKLMRTFPTPHRQGTAQEMKLSPDGKWLISLQGNHLHVWEIATGILKCDFQHDKIYYTLEAACFSPDSATIAAIARENRVKPDGQPAAHPEYQVWTWNLHSGQSKLLYSTNEGEPSRLVFSPDGSLLAAARPGVSRLWLFDLAVGKLRWSKDHSAYFNTAPTIAFSHDNKSILEFSKRSYIVRHCETGEILKDEPINPPVELGSCSLSTNDGRILLISPALETSKLNMQSRTPSNKPIRLFNLQTLQWLPSIPSADDPYSMVRLSANGSRQVTLNNSHVIQVWEQGKLLHQLKLPGQRVEFFLLSPDGNQAAFLRQDKTIYLMRLDQLHILPQRDLAMQHWLLSENTHTLYVLRQDGKVRLDQLDAATLKTISSRELLPPKDPSLSVVATNIYLTAQGQRILCTINYWGAGLFDITDSTRIATHQRFPFSHMQPVDKLSIPRLGGAFYLAAWSIDKRAEYFGQAAQELHLFEGSTGKERMRLDPGFPVHGFRAAEFNRDGRWLALLPGWLGGNTPPAREIQLWDTQTQHLAEHITYASDFIPEGVSLRADGQQLLTWNQTGQLYSWDKQHPWKHIPLARQLISQAILTADGKYIATYGNGDLSLWEAETQRRLYSVALDPKERWEILFTAGDTMLLAASSTRLQLWPLDLSRYLSQQAFPPLTPSQKKELGMQ